VAIDLCKKEEENRLEDAKGRWGIGARQEARGVLHFASRLRGWLEEPTGEGLDAAQQPDSDENQQPQGGGANAGETNVCETRRPVAEGGSVQCGGVALAQLEALLKVYKGVNRRLSAKLEEIAEQDETNALVELMQEADRELAEKAAELGMPGETARVHQCLAPTQQSSGGQEAEDDRQRLRGIASLIEVNFNRDDALRDARFLRKLADRLAGGQEGGVEEYRVVVKQGGGQVQPLGIEPRKVCVARLKDICAEIQGSEIEDAWIERRTVARGPWQPISDNKSGEGNG
jgi:hypothetical protein